MCFKVLEKYSMYRDIPLRLALGLIFVVAGFGKLMDIGGVTEMLAGNGFPIAGVFAWILAIVEFGGGLALLAGWKTREASALLGFVILVAIFTVKLGSGFGAMFTDIAILGGAVSLMLSGASSYAVQNDN